MSAQLPITAPFIQRIRTLLFPLAIAVATAIVPVRDIRASTVLPSDGGGVGQVPPSYAILVTSSGMFRGTAFAGNDCDECTTEMALPFPISLYGHSFTNARVTSNGILEFDSDNTEFFNQCLPVPALAYSIIPHWDDLDAGSVGGDGVFTATFGDAPHRIFVVEWRTHYFGDYDNPVNFEVVLREDAPIFEIIYGQIPFNGSSATVGAQGASDQFTQYTCEQSLLSAGLRLTFGFAPVYAGDDEASLFVNGSEVTLDVLANDADFNGNLQFAALTAASHGYVSLSADGMSVIYKPVADYVGADSFTYTVTNIFGGSDTGIVSIAVINRDPVARDDSAVLDEDSSVTISVLANDDFAPDIGETLSVISAGGTAHGKLVYTPTSVTYTPAPNYFGADSFSYTISDNHGGTATATVNVTVRSVNDNPSPANDTATVDQGSSVTIPILANDNSGPDTGETIAITAVGPAEHGSVQIADSGVIYTPAAGFSGQDSFTYTISDGNGGSASAVVVVSVRKVNSAPEIALTGSAAINENGLFTLQGVINDSDAADTHTVVINWGDGSDNSSLQLAKGSNTFSVTHRFLDNPTSGSILAPISATVTDVAGESATGTLPVSVQNVAPTIGSITTSANSLRVGAALTVTVNFADPGTLDTHQVRIAWGDGSADTILNDGGYSRSGTHTYAAQGIFRPVITVNDKDGASVSAFSPEIAVYDSAGGQASLTGSGWAQLPNGVSASNPSLSGKALFAVETGYSSSGSAKGYLAFTLGLHALTSTSVDWLMVSGNTATIEGKAKIDGSGGYRYRFTGFDGKATSQTDQLRLKIWSVSTGALVFDSAGTANANNSSLLTRIGGGNVTVRPQTTSSGTASTVKPPRK